MSHLANQHGKGKPALGAYKAKIVSGLYVPPAVWSFSL